MFIGKLENNNSVNFARPIGSKDRTKRRRTIGRIAAGLGATAALGAGIKNRKAIRGSLGGLRQRVGITRAILRDNAAKRNA